jgi:Zn-dependent protease
MDKVINLIIDLAVLLFSVAWHESAHGLVAYWLGDPTARERGRISLNPLRHIDLWGTLVAPVILALAGMPILAAAKPTPVDVDRLQDPKAGFSTVALAGPLSNLLLVLLFTLVGLVFGSVLGLRGVGVLASHGIKLNLLLAGFNLLPLPTLDGLKALYVLFPDRLCWWLNRLEPFGFVLLFLALMGLYYQPTFNHIFWGGLERVYDALMALAHISAPVN